MERKLRWMFMVIFFAMIAIPLSTTNLQKDKISESEKRILAPFPSFYNEEGARNGNFPFEFETWINDNIGMRAELVLQNAKIQYYVFNILSNNSDYILGTNGELNFATNDIIRSYQHLNLQDEATLQYMAEGFRFADEYCEAKGIQFYYYQCWDKQSIYPEYFPKTIVQHGNISRTDNIVDNLSNNTDVTVISPKQELIEGKKEYPTYSLWGDPTHWTQRGAYIGYKKLMNTLNDNNCNKYKVLGEEDYNIVVSDLGQIIFGGIHKEDYLESFEILSPQAIVTNDKLSLYSEDVRHRFFTNESAQNRDRVLVLGDSYFNDFILDDLAESFYETLIIWGDHTETLEDILEAYNPDILIVENAERCDRTIVFASAALAIRDKGLTNE